MDAALQQADVGQRLQVDEARLLVLEVLQQQVVEVALLPLNPLLAWVVEQLLLSAALRQLPADQESWAQVAMTTSAQSA